VKENELNYSQETKEMDGKIGVMNQFSKSYELAEGGKCEPFWNDVYLKAFPNMTNHMRGKKEYCNSQIYGVDRIIYLENGKTITLDEKIRKETWNDIALEFISNDKYNTPGWMEKDLSIDYLAYAFLPLKTAYLFDWRMLKRAWAHFKEEWKEKYFKAKADNYSDSGEYLYTTHSVCVPIKVLMEACNRAIIIQL
jgi:hypothetical protein